jgi:hypothetical protein
VVKLILEQARFGEHQPWVNMDVVVHFTNPDFDGLSFGLALALADKRARYGSVGRAGRLVATGVVGPQGVVEAVEAFAVKLTCMEQVLTAGDLFIYPARNVSQAEAQVQEALGRLRSRGIVLRAVEYITDVRDLWNWALATSTTAPITPRGAADLALKSGGVSMPYTAEISRVNPSCLLFLIDQSGSMDKPLGGSPKQPKKAERLADAINRVLYELVIRCTRSHNEGPRDYFDVGVIGYGSDEHGNSRVGPALGGLLMGRDLVPISELANHPARVEVRPRKVEDGAGGLVEETVKFAIWLDPVAEGNTPMGEALRQARTLLEPWVQTHPNSFPPIVINITDGDATDDNRDPRPAAEVLRTLATTDGNVLLFNLHLSSHPGMPLLYPESATGLVDPFAQQLFEMSSVLPPSMREFASSAGYALGPQSRGFVFNADIAEVITFLDLGTRPRPLH